MPAILLLFVEKSKYGMDVYKKKKKLNNTKSRYTLFTDKNKFIRNVEQDTTICQQPKLFKV